MIDPVMCANRCSVSDVFRVRCGFPPGATQLARQVPTYHVRPSRLTHSLKTASVHTLQAQPYSTIEVRSPMRRGRSEQKHGSCVCIGRRSTWPSPPNRYRRHRLPFPRAIMACTNATAPPCRCRGAADTAAILPVRPPPAVQHVHTHAKHARALTPPAAASAGAAATELLPSASAFAAARNVH